MTSYDALKNIVTNENWLNKPNVSINENVNKVEIGLAGQPERWTVCCREKVEVDFNTLYAIIVNKEYGVLPNQPEISGSILDIGGYVGGFARYAVESKLENRSVIVIEPVSANVGMIQRNMENHKEGNFLFKAAVGNSGIGKILCRSAMEHTDRYPIDPSYYVGNVIDYAHYIPIKYDHYEDVPIWSLEELLNVVEICTGTRNVFYMKIDCEDGEYPLFMNASPQDLRQIKYVVGEFHREKEVLDNIFLPLNFKPMALTDSQILDTHMFGYERID